MASTITFVPSEDLRRIQEIEQKVISCIEAAASVAEKLSRIGNVDQRGVEVLCSQFLDHIKEAQALVQDGIKKSGGNKVFDASSYQWQTRASIALEKVGVVSRQLSDMQAVLTERERAQAPAAMDET